MIFFLCVHNLIWEKKDDKAAWIAYNQMKGQYKSLMEGAIPQAFFSDPNQCNTKNDPQSTLPACKQGISTVSVLAKAAQQGQKIYTINQSNQNMIAQLSQSASVKDFISDAVQAGKVVTIHEKPVSMSGWTGAGYSVLDPDTGCGWVFD